VPGFVNYKKGFTRLTATSAKVYQLLAHDPVVLPEKKPLNNFLLFEPSLIHFIFQIFYTKRTSVDQRKTLVSGLHTLSKHTALILPHTFIALGLIQYIFNLFNRCWTNTTATVSAAGKAGGTVIIFKGFLLW
jgi:hypothetical protein